jgi:hypothetical protein
MTCRTCRGVHSPALHDARLAVRKWLRMQTLAALKAIRRPKIRARGDGRQIVIPPPRPR